MEIPEEDLEITFFRSGGPGGQHRNKKETGVRLRHVPTGIVVTATERRERPQNLALARERLERELERRATKPKPRRPTKPTRASIERRLQDKSHRARLKRERREPTDG